MDHSEDPYPEDELLALAEAITAFVERRGGTLAVTPRQLTLILLNYVQMRYDVPWYKIAFRQSSRQKKPTGWTADNERIWQDWITYTFDLEDWNREVIQPLFGTDVRSWEPGTEWRAEIFWYLQHWIRRSLDTVQEFDPRDHTPDRVEGPKNEIDPYLIENGLVKGWTRQWIN